MTWVCMKYLSNLSWGEDLLSRRSPAYNPDFFETLAFLSCIRMRASPSNLMRRSTDQQGDPEDWIGRQNPLCCFVFPFPITMIRMIGGFQSRSDSNLNSSNFNAIFLSILEGVLKARSIIDPGLLIGTSVGSYNSIPPALYHRGKWSISKLTVLRSGKPLNHFGSQEPLLSLKFIPFKTLELKGRARCCTVAKQTCWLSDPIPLSSLNSSKWGSRKPSWKLNEILKSQFKGGCQCGRYRTSRGGDHQFLSLLVVTAAKPRR